MATQYERYGNSAFTYLRTNVSDSDTVIQVYDVRRFASDSNYRVRIGNEIVRVTGVDLNNKTLTVTRGVEGTVVKTHDSGDLVIGVLTQGGLDQMLTDRVLYAKQRPQNGQISDQNGAKAEVADFTWHNQGSATATDVSGTIWMNGLRAVGDDGHFLFLTPPSTPWTFTLGWRPFIANNLTATDGFSQSGLALKNTGNARVILNGVSSRQSNAGGAGDGNLRTSVEYMTSATASSSTEKIESWLRRYDDVMWHRVTDDGVDLIFEISRDGVNWEVFFQPLRTAWLTSGANQVGIYIDPSSADAGGGTGMDNYSAFVHASFT